MCRLTKKVDIKHLLTIFFNLSSFSWLDIYAFGLLFSVSIALTKFSPMKNTRNLQCRKEKNFPRLDLTLKILSS